MDAGVNPNNRTVEAVFGDFKGRRTGIVKALTTELDEFVQQCDPEKENLCLYGFPSEQWEVNLPVEEVPAEIPEPVLGINFARDGMQLKDWLGLVAAHSDAWLISTAFYFGATFGFDRSDRRRLFNMINDLPSVFEAVSDFVTKDHNNSKSKSGSKRGYDPPARYPKAARAEEVEEDEEGPEEEDDDQEDTVCGKCHEYYSTDEFWICCDMCETWFHGKCVRITQSKAAHIKQYKCPSCSKGARH
ncbi:unnamed protein product [Rhodiola kirilowii]